MKQVKRRKVLSSMLFEAASAGDGPECETATTHDARFYKRLPTIRSADLEPRHTCYICQILGDGCTEGLNYERSNVGESGEHEAQLDDEHTQASRLILTKRERGGTTHGRTRMVNPYLYNGFNWLMCGDFQRSTPYELR